MLIQGYLNWFAAVKLPEHEHVSYLMPWFIITKRDVTGELKHRLICNAKELNFWLPAPHFTLESVHTIFPSLRKGMWATRIALKHANFHLGLHADLAGYVVIDIGGTRYRFRSACFGLVPLPYSWMRLMHVFETLARQHGTKEDDSFSAYDSFLCWI